jgi:hypothetical protein
MTTVQRQEFIQIIDTMKADAGVSESIWNCKNNVRKLLVMIYYIYYLLRSNAADG